MWKQLGVLFVLWLSRALTEDLNYTTVSHRYLEEMDSNQTRIDAQNKQKGESSCECISPHHKRLFGSVLLNALGQPAIYEDQSLFAPAPSTECMHATSLSIEDSRSAAREATILDASAAAYEDRYNIADTYEDKNTLVTNKTLSNDQNKMNSTNSSQQTSTFVNVDVVSNISHSSHEIITVLPLFSSSPKDGLMLKSAYPNSNESFMTVDNIIRFNRTFRAADNNFVSFPSIFQNIEDTNVTPGDRYSHSEIYLSSGNVSDIPSPTPVTIAFAHVSNALSKPSSGSSFKIVPVTVLGPKERISVYALLDDGASQTLIDQDIVNYVGAEGPTSQISVVGVGGMSTNSKIQLVDIDIQGLFCNESFTLQGVNSIPNLNSIKQSIRFDDVMKFSYLRDIASEVSYNEVVPTLIIGIDNYHLLLPRELRRGNVNDPAAIRTALGWTVFGKLSNEIDSKSPFSQDPIRIYSASSYKQILHSVKESTIEKTTEKPVTSKIKAPTKLTLKHTAKNKSAGTKLDMNIGV